MRHVTFGGDHISTDPGKVDRPRRYSIKLNAIIPALFLAGYHRGYNRAIVWHSKGGLHIVEIRSIWHKEWTGMARESWRVQ